MPNAGLGHVQVNLAATLDLRICPTSNFLLLMSYLFVAIGGALGSVLRYVLSLVIPKAAGFPWPTFVANVLGCLCIGIFSGLFLKCGTLSPNLKLFW